MQQALYCFSERPSTGIDLFLESYKPVVLWQDFGSNLTSVL